MQKPDYPKDRWRDLVWYFKSDWGDYLRTFAVTAAVVIVTAVAAPPQNGTSGYLNWRTLLVVSAVVYLIGTWSSITKDARRRKYDTKIALKYTDMFFKDFEAERKKATEVLIRFHEGQIKDWEKIHDRSEIDPVLDIFDDIGFLLQGDQISDWVVYQYFSYWIHLYYQAAEGYVTLKQIEDNTQWEHVPALYDDMMKIQEHKNREPREKVIWKHHEMIQALKDEIGG